VRNEINKKEKISDIKFHQRNNKISDTFQSCIARSLYVAKISVTGKETKHNLDPEGPRRPEPQLRPHRRRHAHVRWAAEPWRERRRRQDRQRAGVHLRVRRRLQPHSAQRRRQEQHGRDFLRRQRRRQAEHGLLLVPRRPSHRGGAGPTRTRQRGSCSTRRRRRSPCGGAAMRSRRMT